jgi:hypothetical protein
MPRRRVSFATIAVSGLGAFVAVAVGVTLYVSAAQSWRSTQALIAQQAEAQEIGRYSHAALVDPGHRGRRLERSAWS